MILKGRKVELVPFFGFDDWRYAFELSMQHDKRLTEESMVAEVMTEGFQYWIGYASGVKSGVIFSKHYRDGLTIDGYTDPMKLTRGVAVWYSLTSAHLILTYLLKYTPIVYARAGRNDLQLHRLAKALGMKYDHEEKDRIVYSITRDVYSSFDWDTSNHEARSYAENTSNSPLTYF